MDQMQDDGRGVHGSGFGRYSCSESWGRGEEGSEWGKNYVWYLRVYFIKRLEDVFSEGADVLKFGFDERIMHKGIVMGKKCILNKFNFNGLGL